MRLRYGGRSRGGHAWRALPAVVASGRLTFLRGSTRGDPPIGRGGRRRTAGASSLRQRKARRPRPLAYVARSALGSARAVVTSLGASRVLSDAGRAAFPSPKGCDTASHGGASPSDRQASRGPCPAATPERLPWIARYHLAAARARAHRGRMPCYRVSVKPMTMWETKERAGCAHGWKRKRPKPGQGHLEHPDLWPDEVARERSEILPGGDFIMCGDLGPHCSDPTCGGVADNLCDWPMGKGKTCDLPLCDDHAREIGMDRHMCPAHFPMWVKSSGVERVNPWPPPRAKR